MVATPRRMSNYPGGFSGGLTIREAVVHSMHPGAIFWVDENANNKSNNRGTFESPCESIDAAMSLCVANRGDIIAVKAGHEENISAAAGLVCDVAGVTILGTGHGTKQAKITFDTAATADIDITADNVTFDNIWFYADFTTGITAAIDVAAVDYVTIQNCKVTDASATKEFLKFITIAENAPYFAFNNNFVNCFTGSTSASLVFAESTLIGFEAIGNTIVHSASAAIFDLDDDAIAPGPIFRDNMMINLSATTGLCVAIGSSTVASFIGERYGSNKSNTIPASDLTVSYCIDCMGVDQDNTSSLIWPGTATAWT